MDDSFKKLMKFLVYHFQRQQWEYYVTAPWVACHEDFVTRSIPLCGVNVIYLAQVI